MSNELKTKITEFNPNTLKEINEYLEFSDWDKQPVAKQITYEDYESIGIDLRTILNAIEFIGFNGQTSDLGTCAGLAQIAEKLLPTNELAFLNKLLIQKENNKSEFVNLENL